MRFRKIFWTVAALFVLASVLDLKNETTLVADPSQNKCLGARPQGDPKFKPSRPNSGVVNIIHLTNNGEFADRCELTDALFELNWDHPGPPSCLDLSHPHVRGCNHLAPTIAVGAETKPKLAVLFVHGWMHSASDADKHLAAFKNLIHELDDPNSGRQVVGIYVTWNASTGWWWPIDLLSFWSRQRIADKITQSAVVTKIVASISATRGISGKQDQFIAIGHSFGARMLFAAVNAPLTLAVESSFPAPLSRTYQPIKSIADFVLLLNPAFDASRYTTIDGFMRNEETFASNQKPLTMIIATDNDHATSLAYPLGQWAGLSFDRRSWTTIGNYEKYFTHSLKLLTAGEQCETGTITESFFEPKSRLCLTRQTNWHYDMSIANDPKDPRRWSQVAPSKQEHNPFLLVRTNKAVIDDHGGIWDGKVSPAWLLELLKAMNEKS